MDPVLVDIALLVISILLIFGGYRQGFIRTAGSLLGLVVSIAIGLWGVTWVEDFTGLDLTGNPVTFVFTFLILALIVSQLLRIVVGLLDLVRKLFSIIPFVGLINSILGMALGAAQALLMIGAIAYIADELLPHGSIRSTLLASQAVSAAVQVEKDVNILN